MARFRTSAALVLIGTALAGCMGTWKGVDRDALRSNGSLYSENQPVVERTNFAFDVSTSNTGVGDGDMARLADWFESLQLRYGDRIFVDDPAGSEAVRSDVARLAADYGMLLSNGSPVTPGAVQPGSARIVVARSTASVPGCPNWRQARLPGSPISTSSNFGCASNSNLAAMVANPEDLVRGREGRVAGDPETASKAIRTYREAEPTGAGGLDDVSTTEEN